MTTSHHTQTQSVSETFVEAATKLLEDAGLDMSTNTTQKLRSDVIRNYEIKLREADQRALFGGAPIVSELEEAQTIIQDVNNFAAANIGLHHGIE